MQFSYTLIVLFGFTAGTVLTQHEAPQHARHPQCPALLDNSRIHNEHPRKIASFDSTSSEGDACDQNAPYSSDCMERSTATASGGGRAQEWHRQLAERPGSHGKMSHGMAHKHHLRTRKHLVLRRPVPITSILFYKRRRHTLALMEAQIDRQRQRVSLAVSRQISPMTGKRRHGYELKVGNYRVKHERPRWVLV